MSERRWLSLRVVEAAARAARNRGVSEVARGPGGFLTAFRKARGRPGHLGDHSSGQAWRDRRNGFVARHAAQADDEPMWASGAPTDRHLALAVWAYSPDSGRLERWLKREGFLGGKRTRNPQRELIPGGKASGRSPRRYRQDQLAAGTVVELEHTPDRRVAREIAMDHLEEIPDYYDRLERMERSAPKRRNPAFGIRQIDEMIKAQREDPEAFYALTGVSARVRWKQVREAVAAGEEAPTAHYRDAYAKWKAGPTADSQARLEAAREAERQAEDEERYEAQGVDPEWGTDLRRLRGKRVWLYHGTSTALLPRLLRDGIEPGRAPSNVGRSAAAGLRTKPWVYLTSDSGPGPASAFFYARGAAAQHGGRPVVLRVLVDGDDLRYDPDDRDLGAGRKQYVVREVPASAIMEVDGTRIREIRGAPQRHNPDPDRGVPVLAVDLGPSGAAVLLSADGRKTLGAWGWSWDEASKEGRALLHDAPARGQAGVKHFDGHGRAAGRAVGEYLVGRAGMKARGPFAVAVEVTWDEGQDAFVQGIDEALVGDGRSSPARTYSRTSQRMWLRGLLGFDERILEREARVWQELRELGEQAGVPSLPETLADFRHAWDARGLAMYKTGWRAAGPGRVCPPQGRGGRER